jgi:glycosyltransferase family protein
MIRIFRKIIEKVYSYILRLINFSLLVLNRYPNVLNSYESVNVIVEKRLSVSRFGDGELNIIKGTGYDSELARRLVEVLRSNDPGIAICIPDVFKDRSRLTDSARKFWFDQVLNNLFQWNKYTINNKSYLDALFTRFYMDLNDKEKLPESSVNLLKKIWDKYDLLIIEGAGSRLGYQNDLFVNAKSIKRILCPAENAFSKYNQILELSEKYAKDKLVLIALGMTATVLAYDLARKGFRAIDLGHIDIEYEWYKMKATKKVPVKYRYMNEVSVREFDELKDMAFTSQILAEIK